MTSQLYPNQSICQRFQDHILVKPHSRLSICYVEIMMIKSVPKCYILISHPQRNLQLIVTRLEVSCQQFLLNLLCIIH